MNNRFEELGISEPILKALARMGYEVPTPVQAMAIPRILKGEDLIVRSKTGSGKTAVFGVSMLELIDPDAKSPRGLILTPTRELAVQVDSDIKQMAQFTGHKTTAVYGQHSLNVEIDALKKGVSIVTGTPGRVFDHVRHGSLKTNEIRFLILDEADRMLDMGFIDQVMRIIRTIPKERRTMLFSATIPPEIHRICSSYMKDPGTIEIESPTKTVDTIEQVYYRVERNEKRTQLDRILTVEQPDSCIIFCNTRVAVDSVQTFLSRKGYAADALHGDIPQGKRLRTINEFKSGKFPILVATDVAARGIHIDSLSLVINYDVPSEKDSYVHRIGRTGRAGNVGRAVTFVTSNEFYDFYAIEEHVGAMIPEGELPTDAEVASKNDSARQWKQTRLSAYQPAPAPQASKQKAPSHEGSRDRNRQGGSRPAPRPGDRRPAQSAKPAPPQATRPQSAPKTQPQRAAAESKPPVSAPVPASKTPEKKGFFGRLFGRK